MGENFDFTIVSETEAAALTNIDDAVTEIKRIEKLISSWDENSETSLINKNAGLKPVQVSIELFQLIQRAIQLSEFTSGAFDITYASMNTVWKFDGSLKNIPTHKEILNSIEKVDYKNIVLDVEKLTVFLKNSGMKISFDAIGKGYAADKAKELMKSKKVFAGTINASGDLTTWGRQASGEKWILGVFNPVNQEEILKWLPMNESAVSTSRNFDKFIEFNGEKFSHIIDPRTGYPTKDIKKVSVFSKSAELCDALATAVFSMGITTSLALINQHKNIEIIIVDSENKIHTSEGILLENPN